MIRPGRLPLNWFSMGSVLPIPENGFRMESRSKAPLSLRNREGPGKAENGGGEAVGFWLAILRGKGRVVNRFENPLGNRGGL